MNLLKPLILFGFMFWGTLAAALSIGFNPYYGSGTVSDGSEVQSATGIRASFEHSLIVAKSRFSLGPRIEVGNTYLNTKQEESDKRLLSTYDTRFLVGGIMAGWLYYSGGKFPNQLYMSLCTGQATSKLSQDQTGDGYYAQRNYSDIGGGYYTAEIGTNVQVRHDMSFNFSVAGNQFDARQDKANGSMSGEYANKEGVFSLSDDNQDQDYKLPNRVVQKIVTLNVGLKFSW